MDNKQIIAVDCAVLLSNNSMEHSKVLVVDFNGDALLNNFFVRCSVHKNNPQK